MSRTDGNNTRFILLILLYSFKTMAQSEILFPLKTGKTPVVASADGEKQAALVLLEHTALLFKNAFEISQNKALREAVHLEIDAENGLEADEFEIRSSDSAIFLTAQNAKTLRYASYTLLELWGFRKFSAQGVHAPETDALAFPKNFKKRYRPSFSYRAVFYPDAFDAGYRNWHKLDWHLDDFEIWGHSFSRLAAPEDYFASDPDFFALYENLRNPASLCMSEDAVFEIAAEKIGALIEKHPGRRFFSVSQNDDAVFCECSKCSSLNKKHGGPQGSLYYFLNRIASRFPDTDFTTLAYLHTFNPPENLEIEKNIYTFLCPIELDRGKSFAGNKNFRTVLEAWSNVSPHLFLWDYTVQFTNYLAPFPNMHTFSENMKILRDSKVQGLFLQGYGDVNGDFSELRAYLLAKLSWDADADADEIAADFLQGFYGKAAPFIKEYLLLMAKNQQDSGHRLDIYSGPVQNRSTYLAPEAMDAYDKLISRAEDAASHNAILKKRVEKIRLALEYAYFEQSKFYGKDRHGMFDVLKDGNRKIKPRLTRRVKNFAESCKSFGIYELGEGGISPAKYYEEWLEISKNTRSHLGENLKASFLTAPADEFQGKGPYSLVDGGRGSKDFNINWVGWYGNDAEILLETGSLKFEKLVLHFLEDQRHWIFRPEKAVIYGLENGNWVLLEEKKLEKLTDEAAINILPLEFYNKSFAKFTAIKLLIANQRSVPQWRKRKNKKPMLMVDEIELY
ncbi:MAG TPA: DUF4838 domain-containing protein [Flavobacterium sp.]|nr:DUF4838 domain-containing protein [Flavobacterium sp.]